MPFPCPHCATPQEDNNTSCNHCGLAFGPGTDRPGAVTTEANGTESSQVTNFQELLAAVAARGSEVDPRAIPPPAPTIDLSQPDPNLYTPSSPMYGQPGQSYPNPGQGHPQPGQQYPPAGQYFSPQQFGNQPYNITLYPNGSPQGINITQYPQFSGMNATLMPVAVPVRQGLSIWATLLIATLFGALIAMVVFLLLHAGLSSGPSVKISQPGGGTIIAAGQTVDFSVEATDNTGRITNVDFYYQVGNQQPQFIKTVVVPPYSTSWTPTATGDYVLEAVGTDDHEKTSTARTSVRVNGGTSPVPTPTPTPAPAAPAKPAMATPQPTSPAAIKPAAMIAPILPKAPASIPKPVTPKPVAAKPAAAHVAAAAPKPSASWASNADAIRRAREARAARDAAYRRSHPTPRPAVHVAAAKPAPPIKTSHESGKQYHITTLVSPNKQNAEILTAALRKRGINVHTERVGSGWAVQTPGYHSKSEADSAARQLQKSGYNAGISN